MSDQVRTFRIVLDWGTTTFRALLVDADGRVVDKVETPEGIQAISKDGFAQVLRRALEPWRSKYGILVIYAAGMIGSRNGWVEMPYVATPADAADLARSVRRMTLDDGSVITFIPGLTDPSAKPFPDVMRGEEAQLVGLGLDRDRTVVLPGTHSKWAQIQDGKIRRFQTFVTGEVFGTLSRHSFLAKVALSPDTTDWAAFGRGLDTAFDENHPSSLLTRLFAVRTGWLAGELDPSQMVDYLSGLIVGSEFREARDLNWVSTNDEIAIVGDDDLVDVYRRAALRFGLRPEIGPGDAAMRGCLAIADLVAA